jgi:hypothetical protein
MDRATPVKHERHAGAAVEIKPIRRAPFTRYLPPGARGYSPPHAYVLFAARRLRAICRKALPRYG